MNNNPDHNNNTPPHNPYASPEEASIQYNDNTQYSEGHFGLLAEARKCSVVKGFSWLTTAFGMLKENFVFCLVSGIILFLILFVGSYIPYINILVVVFGSHFAGGFMLICAKEQEGEVLEYADIFSAFKTHFVPLLLLFLLVVLAAIVIMIPVVIIMAISLFLFIPSDMAALTAQHSLESMPLIGVVYLSIMLVVLIVMFMPLFMAMAFAPVLVVLHDRSPIDALKSSFKGCLKNIIPFLLYGLVMIVVMPLFILCTLGLGLLVIYPLIYIMTYVIYRDFFSERMITE